jgi:hypothetical protein
MEFGETPLAEPFFEHTREKLATAGARVLETGADALFRLASQLREAKPAGIIFHISHCGSTLLANALRTARDTVVFSEDLVLARLFQPFPAPPSPHLEAWWNGLRRRAAEAVFRIEAAYRCGEAGKLVLKLPSFATAAMPLLRRWWPDVPCVVVIREPQEVIASQLLSGWGADRDLAGLYEIYGLPSPAAETTAEEVCGAILGNLMKCALETSGPGCRIVDYEDLRAKIPAIGGFFGLELPPGESRMDEVFRRYAKDPTGRMVFSGDKAAKRQRITRAVSEAARRVRPAYEKLRSL